MLNFDYCLPTRLVFGKGSQNKIGGLVAPFAKKVLLLYGGGSIKKSGLYDSVTASLKASGVEYAELGGVLPNPRLSLVREGVALCIREKAELILAVGGGSVIDTAKAIAFGVYAQGDIWDYYETGKAIEKALPIAVVLTIPAAGSECSIGSVITNEEKQRKLSYDSELIIPRISVINPELFFTLPKEQVANGIADMVSHVFERYFTNTTHTDLTDNLAEGILKTILKNTPLVLKNPQSYNAWCEIGFSGTTAHNGYIGLGREQEWGCHTIAAPLSAVYDMAHGASLAVITPAWMRYVYRANIPMFAQFAVNVMGARASLREPEAIIEEGITRLEEFFRSLGLPSTLSEAGIGDERFEWMAKQAAGAAVGGGTGVGSILKLDWQDIVNIYRLVK